MINLISTFYISNYSSSLDNLRSIELETCLLNNLSSTFIKKIHLFVDDFESLERLNIITNNSEKIVIIEVGKKPSYYDFFNYIINNLKEEICMISNSDIYIHQYDDILIQNLINNKIAYALTRYEYDMSQYLIDEYGGSHDCYIFNSSFLTEKILSSEDIQFLQNLPGIESHIIKALYDEGLSILNPCFQIKIVHLHKTKLRNHGQWIGLHKYGDFDYHKKSCWWVPPTTI